MVVKKRFSGGWLRRGGMALLAGGVGGVGIALLLKRSRRDAAGGVAPGAAAARDRALDRWARPGMGVTFRAELMPGRDAEARTFRVAELLPSGRVRLEDIGGEHDEHEFEGRR